MGNLAAAHRGYGYQDLLVAARLVDVMLESVVTVLVDRKLVADDRFDDLTTVSATGHRERTQFKYTDSECQALTLATFTNDNRGLRLDRLVGAALADRDGPGADASDVTFRVVLADSRPLDERLLEVLEPASPDPGPYLPGFSSFRMRFKPANLWPESSDAGTAKRSGAHLFSFLRQGIGRVDRADLEWVCARLVIEVEAPAATLDLTSPGSAELVLLARVGEEIGAGLHPNADRSVVDVAGDLVTAAGAARQGSSPTRDELLRRTRIRHDFGAVARLNPVDKLAEVPRPSAVEDLARAASSAAASGHPLLAVGPPGHGKSWTCAQLIEELVREGWIVAEHYCYLSDADGERIPRVHVERVFGSLLERLAEADSRLVADQRPRFAADEQALADAVARALDGQSDRRVALVVDGIDHVTRVLGRRRSFDPSLELAERLGLLSLPRGSVLLVLSQPGSHLRPLEDAGATTVSTPGFSDAELRQLAQNQGLVPWDDDSAEVAVRSTQPLLTDKAAVADFLDAVRERSAGNALYATYLCREARMRPESIASPSETVRNLPAFRDSLEDYYRHLQATLGDGGIWVADVVALLDFPVTASELKEIIPEWAHRVDSALEVLRPVLVQRIGQGGVRVYHESFARFLRQPFLDDPTASAALLDRIATWLESRGLLKDSRAFCSLLGILAESGRDREVVDLVDGEFVLRAVAAGFPASAIIANLATAIGCAGRIGDWPAIVRYVEMSRSAETYQEERFDSTVVSFADVPLALIGAEAVTARLLHDGRTVMAAREGLQMCAAVDALGAVAPWREYMTAYLREVEQDNTSYGDESDRLVEMAWLRGRLRLSSGSPTATRAGDTDAQTIERVGGDGRPSNLAVPISWAAVASGLEQGALSPVEVVDAILDTHGSAAAVGLTEYLEHPGAYCLALADSAGAGRIPESHGDAQEWASAAIDHGLPPGSAHRPIALGVSIDRVLSSRPPDLRSSLLELTRQVMESSVRWNTGSLEEWLDACCLAARVDPLGLDAAEALATGPGWYPCWLRFVISLVRAEAAPVSDQERLALEALRLLEADLNPFAGAPRACDLYPIRSSIDEAIRRALELLGDEAWGEAICLLDEVSNAIATTIFGEQGGPLSRADFLQLAVETSTSARYLAAHELVEREIENGADGRSYADLAEYRLLAARLALLVGNREEAGRLWVDACAMLTAYGWHKDITIYELLNPLPTLIAADPARGRGSVASLQPLCERVARHTDGRETSHARREWWSLLAAADPAGLVRLIAPALLGDCNGPNELFDDARSELWRAWQDRVDPVVAGALRLTLRESLDSADSVALANLADVADDTGLDVPAQLMTLLMARVDERPFKYSYSNGEELLASDAQRVHELNAMAERVRVSRIVPVPEDEPDHEQGHGPGHTVTPSGAKNDAGRCLPQLASGRLGLAQAIREWRRLRYDEARRESTIERFVNILGYRVLELAENGGAEDASHALEAIANAVDWGDTSGLLAKLGEGFELHGQSDLAVAAHTFAWTRSRGQGGWLTFGGETAIESLHRATALDRDLTLRIVADETERVVAGRRYGTWGVTQAILLGLASGDLVPRDEDACDLAFRAWTEAFRVIAERAPRVGRGDDPDEPYVPSDADVETEPPGDVGVAFAVATLTGLAHASREQKRRALVAAKLLLNERVGEAGQAFKRALSALSDPAALMWLLRILEGAGAAAEPVVALCSDVLLELAGGPHLTVRALARRVLGDREVPLPPVASPDTTLLSEGTGGLWTPDWEGVEEPTGSVTGLVDSVAGVRLERAEPLLPGLGDAVRRKVTETVAGSDFDRRLRRQFEAYSSRVERRMPDAYLASEEAVESALQLVAAGGRAASLMRGLPVLDPVGWEDDLATALLDDPAIPVCLEAARHPRPNIPPPPGLGDLMWSDLRTGSLPENERERAGESTVQGVSVLRSTISVLPAETTPTVEAGRFIGWRLVATVERRISSSSDRRDRADMISERFRAVEIQDPNCLKAQDVPPLAEGGVREWVGSYAPWLAPSPRLESRPLFGLDLDAVGAGDARVGLGLQVPLLSPTPWLVAFLGLHAGEAFVLDDQHGSALALMTWRARYETSEYEMAWPRLCGAAITLRDDLFARLIAEAGGHLVFRDFVLGDPTLAAGGGE